MLLKQYSSNQYSELLDTVRSRNHLGQKLAQFSGEELIKRPGALVSAAAYALSLQKEPECNAEMFS